MPNIKPVSELQDYSSIIEDISVNSPVFLTQNGQGRFVLMDIDEYEHTKATISLLAALAEGEQSASAQGCTSLEEVERNLGL